MPNVFPANAWIPFTPLDVPLAIVRIPIPVARSVAPIPDDNCAVVNPNVAMCESIFWAVFKKATARKHHKSPLPTVCPFTSYSVADIAPFRIAPLKTMTNQTFNTNIINSETNMRNHDFVIEEVSRLTNGTAAKGIV